MISNVRAVYHRIMSTTHLPPRLFGGQSPKCPGPCPSLRVLRMDIEIRPPKPGANGTSKNTAVALVK